MAGIETLTVDGFPLGSNLATPSQELPDTYARYIQDALVHEVGFTDRRGPVKPVTSTGTLTDKAIGLVTATTAAGDQRVAAVCADGTNVYLKPVKADLSFGPSLYINDFGINSIPSSPDPVVYSKPLANGETVIGIADAEDDSAQHQYLVFWGGGRLANYSTGTATNAANTNTVTGSGTSFVGNVEPGMYLFAQGATLQFVGVVDQVTSNTALLLTDNALFYGTGYTYVVASLRGFGARVTTGNVTAATSAPDVFGANTKFREQGVAAGWKLYRRGDRTYVGDVLTVNSNVSITLTANAAIALQNDDYLLINNAMGYEASLQTTAPKPGYVTAAYGGIQYYANRSRAPDAGGRWGNRLWYTDSNDPEDIDMSVSDGNFIPIQPRKGGSATINSLIPTYDSLVIFMEHEVSILKGQTEDDYEVRPLYDDGALSGMATLAENGEAIWVGREGIYRYDGIEVENLVEDTLGQWYIESVKDFNPRTSRVRAEIVREHLLVHFDTITPPTSLRKGNVATTPTYMTICIYLPRKAVTFMTNLRFAGVVHIGSSLDQTSWYVVNTAGGGRICNGDSLFDEEGVDTLTCTGATAGPDLYIESKRYSVDDGMRKKLWKQLMLHYLVTGDSLKMDTVVGLNDIGTTATTEWKVTNYTWDKLATQFRSWDSLALTFPTWDALAAGIFIAKRIKFLKRSQYLSFRLYQKSNAVTAARLGTFALGYKLQKKGRV